MLFLLSEVDRLLVAVSVSQSRRRVESNGEWNATFRYQQGRHIASDRPLFITSRAASSHRVFPLPRHVSHPQIYAGDAAYHAEAITWRKSDRHSVRRPQLHSRHERYNRTAHLSVQSCLRYVTASLLTRVWVWKCKCLMCSQKPTGSQLSLLYEPNWKVNGEKLKRKPLSSPESVKAVRWKGGSVVERISGKDAYIHVRTYIISLPTTAINFSGISVAKHISSTIPLTVLQSRFKICLMPLLFRFQYIGILH